MRTNLIITDNFYGDPDSVREFALKQEFNVTGNYPGARTKSFLTPDLREAIQTVIWNAGGEINNWFEHDGFSGSFQLTTANDRSWIHTDHFNKWAGVIYLTPDAPVTGGTGLFMYKENGATTASEMGDRPYEPQDMTKWHKYDVLANKYNRLVLYRGDLFHSSLDYFGSTPDDGRLFQLFFFDTQY
jgi:hypothetical protein